MSIFISKFAKNRQVQKKLSKEKIKTITNRTSSLLLGNQIQMFHCIQMMSTIISYQIFHRSKDLAGRWLLFDHNPKDFHHLISIQFATITHWMNYINMIHLYIQIWMAHIDFIKVSHRLKFTTQLTQPITFL